MYYDEAKVGKECIFAMTTGWSIINYGVIESIDKENKSVVIFNKDENKKYVRDFGWVK